MTFLARFLIVFLSLLLLGRWLLKFFFASPSRGSQATSKKSAHQAIQGQTFKDPQCGMYVASSLAVSQQVGEKEYHFCSARCRDEFLAREAHSARPKAHSL